MGDPFGATPPIAPPSFPEPRIISTHITLQAPLSRRGRGPGLVLVLDHYALIERSEKHLDPPPLQKWAEEGFAVVQLLVPGRVDDGGEFPLKKALEVLKGCEECEFENGVGLICKRCSPLNYALEESRITNTKELRKSMACESAT
jgi:carboxymethylenebutenolidase